MADADLEATYRLFTWRITSNYVPHWDFERMKDEIESFDDWCRVYSRWGARHRDLGDEALAEGDAAAAGRPPPPDGPARGPVRGRAAPGFPPPGGGRRAPAAGRARARRRLHEGRA